MQILQLTEQVCFTFCSVMTLEKVSHYLFKYICDLGIMFEPLISICIPAYKKPHYVVRCLHSVLQQDYKNVEIILSDDSPNEDIKDAITQFSERLQIHYYHNQPALRSPKNWNNALDKANGDLVVLMHQDKGGIRLFYKQFLKLCLLISFSDN